MFRSLRWLYPGLKIKRWFVIIFLGVCISSLGTAFFVFALFQVPDDASFASFAWLTPHVAQSLAVAALAFFIGGTVLFTGLYRLLKSVGQLLHKRGDTSKTLVDIAYERRYLARGAKVVAIGGGTGLSNLLSGLKSYTADITAVISVADDGGSSGKLRKEFDMLPPGDIRKCLIALSDDSPVMEGLLRYRFPEQELGGHSFGNLFITVLNRLTGDFGEAVDQAARMLSVRGRVIPATLENTFLVAAHEDGSKTTGQRMISESSKPIDRVELKPGPGRTNPEIIKAVADADLVVIGPGSLYTSVIPNLLIPGIPEAIASSPAACVYVANVASVEGETRGMGLREHIAAIEKHVPVRFIDYILINSGNPGADALKEFKKRQSRRMLRDEEEGLADADGYQYIREDVVDPTNPAWHSPPKLARALMDVIERHRE
ncbi:MAG: gluconeogenesis factor YvcK family protein [Planctomycetota bacterium]|jgi:uncharacterized cofD-like protein